MQISKTEAFVKLKEQRDELKHEIGVLLEKYKVLIEKKETLQKIKNHISEWDENKTKLELNKMKKQKQQKLQQTSTDHYNTICEICNSNCHLNCGLEEKEMKGSEVVSRCEIFVDDNCNKCDHHYYYHVHLKIKWKTVEEEYEILDHDVLEAINAITIDINNKQNAIQIIEKCIKDLEEDIKKAKQNIQKLIKNLKNICSCFNYEKQLDLSINMLKERTKYLQPNDQIASQYDKLIELLNDEKKLIF